MAAVADLTGKTVLVLGDRDQWKGTVTGPAVGTANWYGAYEVARVDGEGGETVHTSRLRIVEPGLPAATAPDRLGAISAVSEILRGRSGWSREGERVVAELVDRRGWMQLDSPPGPPDQPGPPQRGGGRNA